MAWFTPWRRRAETKSLDDLEAYFALGGTTQSGVAVSITVAVMCWNRDGVFNVWPTFFCPEDNLRTRGEIHSVDYMSWAEDGYIVPTPGNTVDLRIVENHLRELAATYNVKEFSFDDTYGRSMMANLNESGILAVKFPQTWDSMTPAVWETERAIVGGNFKHYGHPVLRWNFDNVQVATGPTGNRRFHKGKSGDKIDGAVATLMAVSRCAAGDVKFITSADWFDEEMFLA